MAPTRQVLLAIAPRAGLAGSSVLPDVATALGYDSLAARRNPTVADSSAAIAKEAGMVSYDQPGDGWTIVLRRQPVRIVAGRPEGGYTNLFELICCDCGDHPDQDYPDVSPELQRVRGPYSITAGIAAYQRHLRLHRHPARGTRAGMLTDAG